MELRRQGNLDTWHFCPSCTRWPKDDTKYERMDDDLWDRATFGALCNQCIAKRQSGVCPELEEGVS